MHDRTGEADSREAPYTRWSIPVYNKGKPFRNGVLSLIGRRVRMVVCLLFFEISSSSCLFRGNTRLLLDLALSFPSKPIHSRTTIFGSCRAHVIDVINRETVYIRLTQHANFYLMGALCTTLAVEKTSSRRTSLSQAIIGISFMHGSKDASRLPVAAVRSTNIRELRSSFTLEVGE
jgi:hypothetical protein